MHEPKASALSTFEIVIDPPEHFISGALREWWFLCSTASSPPKCLNARKSKHYVINAPVGDTFQVIWLAGGHVISIKDFFRL